MATEFLSQATQQTLALAPQIGVGPLDNVMQLLVAFGFFRVVLPFLLIFALFYAILLKTKVLGEDGQPWVKTTASIISMVAAFMVIAYTPVVDAIATFVPQASFLLVVALLVLMLFSFIGFDAKTIFGEKPEIGKYWWVFVPLILIFIAIAGYAAGPDIPILYGIAQIMSGGINVQLDPESLNLLIGLAIVIGIPLLVVIAVVWGSKGTTTATPPRT